MELSIVPTEELHQTTAANIARARTVNEVPVNEMTIHDEAGNERAEGERGEGRDLQR